MSNDASQMVTAKIFEVDRDGHETGGLSVSCMFNPFEYTVSKSNSYDEGPKNDSDTPQAEFFKSGSQTLRLNLLFDTYEKGTDVSLETNKLWKFMLTKDQPEAGYNEKIEPPQVAFEWGVFRFVSYITNMTQKFTLFKHDGMPVRANVDITFTQYRDVNDYPKQNPTSGGGPIERVYRVIAGDRLDTIAADVYRDATKWRLIAENNKLNNPLAIRPGMLLRIPID